ncbi:hypothetical protein [Paludisphaera rhizosphaerae]|uniref:hypothetical protein n=1 Tax=Paludisphaera rhizosphaerae TaxID=2711216 RepID=UPI0013EAECB6|nr:hypothetical protein [Paludisphaera rhizosphaerae]
MTEAIVLALTAIGAAVVAIGVWRDDQRVWLWRREAFYQRVARSHDYPRAYGAAQATLESAGGRLRRGELMEAVLRSQRDEGRPINPFVVAAAVDDVLEGREPRRPR